MVGRQVSHYRVLSRIGAGGMGEVYLADDSSLGRKVALKMLPPAIAADASARQRLFREAQAVASLDQPFICKVYDAGVDADVAFIAMEYVDGMTIRDRLVRGPMPMDEAVRLGGEIADALEFAHARRIVHRDLKLSNVTITPDGHAKVMDFGVARQLPADPADVETIAQTTTASGTLVGTPAYMSPEQLRGEPADARSDVFAFGLVLHEMLTGSHAYPNPTSVATAGAILNDPPPTLSAAEETFRKAIASDDAGIKSFGRRSLGLLEMFRGRYARGADELREAIAINRSQNNTIGEYRNHLLLARGLEAAGRPADARAEVETACVVALFESGDANLPLRTEASARLAKLGPDNQ